MSVEEVELLSDSKYRQFIAAVEKALRSFESTSEWADLISALGKLNKVLNSYSKFVVIPRKLMIGKRLSQCMHPALPSGVHLKALETYNLIFQRIGKKRLSQDLFIYSVGLFPLMSHSAMSVKPVLMKLYEEHFLPVGVALVPSLPGLLLGLLPGIEEGSDYTERTISLLESFSVATDIDIFFDALWQSVITTPAVRLPATIFLLSQLDKHLPPTEQQHLLGKNQAFMVQGLCLALNDSLSLVQRNVLDFLVQLLPLHAPNLSHTHLSTIMTAALGVLLRRDMSLNRRLYAWVLGGNGQSQLSGSMSEDDGNQYFEEFGKRLVVEGMKALFRQQSGPGVDALITKRATKLELLKPFRILLNLLDKPEIGSAILEDILVEVFKNLFFSYQHFNPKVAIESKDGANRAFKKTETVKPSSEENPMEELIKTGNLLFNTFEPYFMWQYIAKLLASCNRRGVAPGSNVPTGEKKEKKDREGKSPTDGEVGKKGDDDKLDILDVIRLTDFILNIVALESSVETESKHWPELLSQIIQELAKGCENLTLDELEEGVLLCSKLLSKLTPSTNFVRDTSTPFSRNLASPSLSPTDSEFDLTDSIEYDSKTFEDSLENTSSRDNGMTTPEILGNDNTRDGSRNKLESHDSIESRDSFESHDSIGSRKESESSDITTGARDQPHQSRDITFRSRDQEPCDETKSREEVMSRDVAVNGEASETWSTETLEHVTGQRFKTPKFEKSSGNIDGESKPDKVDGGKLVKQNEYKVEEETKKKGNAKSEIGERKNEKVKESKKDGHKKEMDEKMKEKHKKEKRRVKEKSKSKRDKNEKGKPRLEVDKNSAELKQQKSKNNEEFVKHDSQSMLVRKCIDHFMNFILEFFKWKIFRSEKAMEMLTNEKFSHFKQIDLRDKASSACTGYVDNSCNVPSPAAKTYAAMCKLLVELSCFPMQDKRTELDRTIAKEKGSLPLWLRCLLACCYQVDDFDIQSTSVATVLDLINLTLSVSPGIPTASVGVIVIPILTLDEVMVIEKSDIYKVIANSLWSILGRPLPIHHRKAVELLIQLHNLTPSPHLCENVIGSSMVSANKESRLEALKRFANLWHIAKSILSQNVQGRTARGLRTFDRSLFVMLDGLESEEPEIRSRTKMWVSHSLEQGDIGRILEPLLLLLLHPSTARVSHFYCEREKKRKRESGTETGAYGNAMGEQEDDEVQDGILEDVDNTGIEGLKTVGNKEQRKTTSSKDRNSTTGPAPQSYIRPSDMHKLHYSGKCDYHRILYAFRTLSGVLRVVPRQFVCASAATSIGGSFGPYEERIKELLIRHKRSLFGKGFYGPLFGGKDENTDTSTKASPTSKFVIKPNTSKYLEILITITLYFIRSHYLPSSNVSREFLEGNVKTQVSSLECLSNLTWELVKLVRESGHGFGNFITDLLSRCRVQKAIIHCLAATVNETCETPISSRRSYDTLQSSSDSVRAQSRKTSNQSPSLSESSRSSSESLPESSRRPSEETVDQMILQSKLLEVVESLIVLEHALLSCIEALTPDHLGNSDFEIIMKGGEDGVGGPNLEGYTSRFIQGKSLSSQEMLLNMVLCCLKAQGNFEMSSRWTGFVIECLPYLGTDLKKWVVPVVLQMCSNISVVTRLFKKHKNGQEKCSSSRNKLYPPDHLLAVLAGLTSICHFCVLDAVSSPVFTIQPRAGSTVGSPGVESGQKPVRSMQIFANLLHAFSSNSKSNDSSVCVDNCTPLLEAREGLLSVLPQIIGTLLSLWGAWSLDNPNESLPSSMALLGTPKALRQNILQLLTPIAMTHTIVFLASIADVWNTKKLTEKDLETKSQFFLAVSDDQLRVISLVLDIKALSLEVVIDTVRQILHQELTNRDKGFEASLLQFFHEFLQRSPVNHITQAKSSFLALLKDCIQLNLPPPAVFLLLVNLHTYCVKVPGKEDRKLRKETQDVAQRLIESCTSIAGLSLGSSAWFSRNLSVITLPETTNDETSPESESDTLSNDIKPETPNKPASSNNNNAGKHSTQALIVLADILASLLDILFGSEEKERVVNFLINVMGNVTPYLRNHSVANVPNFRACCALVAFLSGYQYTRKAWRRETFELFFEASFFQMDSECVGNWRIITDNLFTQDQASFRELMARVTSSTAISIFGNQEQEMQQRAFMLKRLSFAVFSSEPDQYQSFLPEMQERLAECLRMPQVPVLHEQVFLFFRVLLVRMSDNMTSIWPMIISEMIHVFMLMESDLLQGDTPSRDQQMFYSETVLGASGYVNYSQEKWLGLYLSVCKLLDMAFCLPPELVPQFQMYRWAFEGAASETAGNLGTIFRPYVSRITKLLAKRKNIYVTGKTLECHAGRPLLTMYQLESLDELLPFLRILSKEGRILLDMRSSEKSKTRRFKTGNSRNYLEKLIERDFLDPLGE